MPLIVRGPAGDVVRLVKSFVTGQWLCDRLGAEGSGCSHTLNSQVAREAPLNPGRADRQADKGLHLEQLSLVKEGYTSVSVERTESRGHVDGKGGAKEEKPLVRKPKRGSKHCAGPTTASDRMESVTRFWDSDQSTPSSASTANDNLDFCRNRAFRPGGQLHYLMPFLHQKPHFNEPKDCQSDEDSALATDSPSKSSYGRGRRRAGASKRASSIVTVSVAMSGETGAESPSHHGHTGAERKPQQTKSAGAQGLATSMQRTKASSMTAQPAASRTVLDKPGTSGRMDSTETGGAQSVGSSVRLPQGGSGGGKLTDAPIQRTGPGKNKMPFRISNPLEVVRGFVEEVQDMVLAAAGKKRGPTKEAVAAWEEKALAKSLLRKKHASLVLFYSKQCQLCQSFTPMVNDMARKESWWLDVCYVDVDNKSWMPEVVHYDVNYVPCFMYLTPNGLAVAKTGAPLSKDHVLDGLQKVMSGAHPECKLARRRLAEKVHERQKQAYAKAKADWEAQKKERAESGQRTEHTNDNVAAVHS